MGEIAEMVLEGILCEGCGGVVDGEASGYPRRCRSCGPITLQGALSRSLGSNANKAARHNHERRESARSRKPFECDRCSKLCRTPEGLAQHKRDKHS